MNGFRRWFANLMVGRYGMDDLNRLIMYVSLALIVINMFISYRWLHLLIVILLIVLYARMFSKSIYNRQKENQKYLELKSRFTSGRARNVNPGGVFGRKSAGAAGGFAKKSYDGKRILICPYCKEKLKVPVGAGTIKIRCPHCKREFEETV